MGTRSGLTWRRSRKRRNIWREREGGIPPVGLALVDGGVCNLCVVSIQIQAIILKAIDAMISNAFKCHSCADC